MNGKLRINSLGDSSMKKETRDRLTIIVLCMLWYIVSSSNNVIGKMVFNRFPYPTTVTMVQLLSITCYSGPFFKLFGIRPYSDIPRRYYWRIIIPLAVGKFLASVSSHVSLWKVPVSYAHTGMNQWFGFMCSEGGVCDTVLLLSMRIRKGASQPGLCLWYSWWWWGERLRRLTLIDWNASINICSQFRY